MQLAKDLNDFIGKFGQDMANIVADKFKPIYDPDKEEPVDLSYIEENRSKLSGSRFRFHKRQRIGVSAFSKAFQHRKRLMFVAEMGVGKTPMSIAMFDHFFRKRKGKEKYTGVVMCPGHIVDKWIRELKWMIPGVTVVKLRRFSDLLRFKDLIALKNNPVIAVGSKDIIKSGFDYDAPACASKHRVVEYEFKTKQNHPDLKLLRVDIVMGERVWIYKKVEKVAVCPDCYETVTDEKDNIIGYDEFFAQKTKRYYCDNCNQRLTTCARGHRSTPHMDKFIQKKFGKKLDFLIADEVHELASPDTIQGTMFGTMVSACEYSLALTGTLIGGMAKDLHAIIWRMIPCRMAERGFNLDPYNKRFNQIKSHEGIFTERYGVVEHREVRTSFDTGGMSASRRYAKTGRDKKVKSLSPRPRPGISPDLFNHFLSGRAGFMRLEELDTLPPFKRELVPVKMDDRIRGGYKFMDNEFQEAIRRNKMNKNAFILSTMRVQCLDQWLDHPYKWDMIHCPDYDENGNLVGYEDVVQPNNFEDMYHGPKDKKVLELVQQELAAGRKCAIYPCFVDKKNVRPKLIKMLKDNGIRVTAMPDNVTPAKREDWIAKHQNSMDVLIVHPQRVMTGMDLLEFPTLIWYQIGYSTHVLRQASARARRIIQKNACKVYFLYYEETIQEQAMALMGEKESASQALEGVFDTEGLKALMNGGESDDVLGALANSIGDDRKNARSAWQEVVELDEVRSNQVSERFEIKQQEFKQPSLFDEEDWPDLEDLF